MKIDFVNEFTFYWGDIKRFSLFNNVDNEMNILANKITCISRTAIKDIADLWVLAKNLPFSWRDIFEIVNKKSPIDPADVSRIVKTVPRDELKLVKWACDIDPDAVHSDLKTIAQDILSGRDNSLKL